jgi:hypothetical protein
MNVATTILSLKRMRKGEKMGIFFYLIHHYHYEIISFRLGYSCNTIHWDLFQMLTRYV